MRVEGINQIERTMANNEIQFILYNMPDDQGKVQVVIKDETLWCTQKAMAQLFDCSTDNIGLHLKNIFASRRDLPWMTNA